MQGAHPQWRGEADRSAALDALAQDASAASTREAMQAKLLTVRRALAGWGLDPIPTYTFIRPSAHSHVKTRR